jgi:dipeptidase E
MLLTSSGPLNEILKSALTDLIGTPFADAALAFIPTASVAEAGDHGWFVEELTRLHGLGWRELDIVELNGLPPQAVLARLPHADVTKVYVGVSAGSMIFSQHLSGPTAAAAQLDFPVYAIDDNSAIRVRGTQIDVVSGGEWLLLNAPA